MSKYKSWREVPKSGRVKIIDDSNSHGIPIGKICKYDLTSYSFLDQSIIRGVLTDFPHLIIKISDLKFLSNTTSLEELNAIYDEKEEEFNLLGDKLEELKEKIKYMEQNNLEKIEYEI